MTFWTATFARAAALVVLSFAMGLLHNFLFSREGIGLTQSPLQAVSGLEEARFIGLEEARRKWEQGVPFIDARAWEFYTYEGHVEGALSLPYLDFQDVYPEIRSELPPFEQEIVCYCSGHGCEESVELAKLLMAEGYRHVLVYEGGWPEWLEAGAPVALPQEPVESR